LGRRTLLEVEEKGEEVRVTPIVPVILIPKKEDKVENDPKPRKIRKKK